MSLGTISDDELALKLMRLYKQLQTARDPDVRESIVAALDGLIAALKQPSQHQSTPLMPPPGAARGPRPSAR